MISASRRVFWDGLQPFFKNAWFLVLPFLLQYFDCLPTKLDTWCRHSIWKMISTSRRIFWDGFQPFLKNTWFLVLPFCFSISTVYPPNKTLGVVIQYGKWSAHQGASFGMVSSHIWKITDFRLQHFRQLAIDFPIKIRFGICSKQLLAMKNRFLTLPKPEKLHFNELLTL